jgi:CDP-paratose 2-epimerase
MHSSVDKIGKPINVGGGVQNSLSLAQLSNWCAETFGAHTVESDPQDRQFDVPWLVLSTAAAKELWDWHPATPLDDILSEIASHARGNPHWLDWSSEI